MHSVAVRRAVVGRLVVLKPGRLEGEVVGEALVDAVLPGLLRNCITSCQRMAHVTPVKHYIAPIWFALTFPQQTPSLGLEEVVEHDSAKVR